jgi:hypothetical protein
MRDMVLITGIFVGCAFGFVVGETNGIAKGMASIPIPAPVEINIEKQCVAWFFNADLKAAKKHMCGNKK